jgi:hypothetical protein
MEVVVSTILRMEKFSRDNPMSENDELLAEARRYLGVLKLREREHRKAGRRLRAQQAKRDKRAKSLEKYLEQSKPLTDAELRKKAVFGDKAIAGTPKDARMLALVNGHIALEREQRALSQFDIDEPLQRWLNQNLGFQPGTKSLTASHKGLRAEAAFLMAKKFRKFFRKNEKRLHFYFITIIHDGWRTLDRETEIDLRDMKTRVRNLLYRLKLDYLGVIEMDGVTNYPANGQGICIMPHVHLIAWSDRDLSPTELGKRLRASKRLASEWNAKTVVVSRLTEQDVAHKAYYLFEQPFKAKRLVMNPKTGEHKLRTVQSWVPAHLTLRLSEILAHCTLKDLIISSGDGLKFKTGLLTALKETQRKAGIGSKPVEMTAKRAFRRLRSTAKKGLPRSDVIIRR